MTLTVLDFVLLFIFILFVIIGAKKGFAKSLLEVAAVILALVLAYCLSTPIATGIYDTFIEKNVVSSIQEEIKDGNISVQETLNEFDEKVAEIPDFVLSLAKTVGINLDTVREGVKNFASSTSDNVPSLVEKIIEPAVVTVISAIAFLVLAVVLVIVLRIIAGLLSKVFELPVVGKVNTALGGVLGAVKGLLIVVLISAVAVALFSGSDGTMGEIVNDTFIIKLLKDPAVYLLK